MKPGAVGPIEMVLPAHNEADSIVETLDEFYRVTTAAGFDIRFRVCEDGSTDGTAEVVREATKRLPITLDSVSHRRNYSGAVIDGFRATTANVVGFIDSDGQCDPADLVGLAAALDDADIVVGYRNPRADTFVRKIMTRCFRAVFYRAFPLKLTDPSCPYLLIRRSALDVVLRGNPGLLPQGFWWEFNARANAAGLRVREVPVRHRVRASGKTVVYLPTKVPGIAWRHLRGISALKRDIAEYGIDASAPHSTLRRA